MYRECKTLSRGFTNDAISSLSQAAWKRKKTRVLLPFAHRNHHHVAYSWAQHSAHVPTKNHYRLNLALIKCTRDGRIKRKKLIKLSKKRRKKNLRPGCLKVRTFTFIKYVKTDSTNDKNYILPL